MEEDGIWWSPRSSKPQVAIYRGGMFDSCPFRIKTMENEKSSALRNIPQVEKLLQIDDIKKFIPVIGHPFVVKIIRRETESFRSKIQSGENFSESDLVSFIISACDTKRLEKLSRVINGTGVILHTNLGRSPVSAEILDKLKNALSGYCNLEYHIPGETRGRRGGYAEELICELTGAEDALIVNNNASSVFLILNQFAKGKETVISRSELIQIGGGFRIPDIMNQTGAIMVETGTTNITELDDFRKAFTENTSMIFSAHQSNYRIEGFTKNPSIKELASIKTDSIILVRDLGSGNLVNDPRLPQPFEPAITSELSQGADLVCFSGDKLLGGCQAGIIIGRKDLVAKLRKHPLMRMLRVDKITYFILQETLLKYSNNSREEILLWKTIFQERKNITSKISRLLKLINKSDKLQITKIDTLGTFGGGSMPGIEFESNGIQVEISGMKPDEIYSAFIKSEFPILGTVANGKFTLDFITIFDEEIPAVAAVISRISGIK